MNSTTTATSARRVSGVDRRKPSDRPISRDVARIRNEYVEMPGLILTLPQAARLWSLSESQSELLLSMLVEAGFLICHQRCGLARIENDPDVLLDASDLERPCDLCATGRGRQSDRA
jgi:hypothetical protein